MIIAHGPWYTEWHHLVGLAAGLGASVTALWVWLMSRRKDAE